jgi:2-iminobutanoate/2-iminopropanoate deaminase
MNLKTRVPHVATAAALTLLALPAVAGHHDPKFFPPPTVGDMKLPFSEAVQVGPFLFLSGQIGVKPGTKELVPGGIQPETRAIMEGIKATVESHGSSMDRVAKCTVFLADMSEWGAMNEVYAQFFKDHFPARSAVAGSGLALGARVEIECIAVVEEM